MQLAWEEHLMWSLNNGRLKLWESVDCLILCQRLQHFRLRVKPMPSRKQCGVPFLALQWVHSQLPLVIHVCYIQEHNSIGSVVAKEPIERASSLTLLTIMVYFSFLSESSSGCVASSGSSTWWFVHVASILVDDSFNNRTLTSPPDLVTAIKEAHSKNENILSTRGCR